MEEAMNEIDEGVKIGEVLLKDVRFADDRAMIAIAHKKDYRRLYGCGRMPFINQLTNTK